MANRVTPFQRMKADKIRQRQAAAKFVPPELVQRIKQIEQQMQQETVPYQAVMDNVTVDGTYTVFMWDATVDGRVLDGRIRILNPIGDMRLQLFTSDKNSKEVRLVGTDFDMSLPETPVKVGDGFKILIEGHGTIEKIMLNFAHAHARQNSGNV